MNIAQTSRSWVGSAKLWCWLGMVSIAVCSLSAVLFRGGLGHWLLASTLLLLAALPLAVVGTSLVAVGLTRRVFKLKRTGIEILGGKVLIVAFLVSLQLLGPFIGDRLTAADMRNAQKFCENLVPQLESWKGTHGGYPDRIEQVIKTTGHLPRLLRGKAFYWSDGTNFQFTVYQDYDWNFFTYGNTSRRWGSD
jgi:hypothetical protein